MEIEVFATCYNEEIILPYFIRHYKQFTDKITIYDNMSSDKSVEIMKNNGVNVISFDTNSLFEEQVLMDIRNSCWKNSNADWVIVCDTDEFIYNTNIKKYLSETDLTHIIPQGYEMISENLPTTHGQIYEEIILGFPKEAYSKPCIFKPSQIQEINFGPGSHSAKPTGNVITSVVPEIKLLHYKYLNRDILIKKYEHYKIRQSFEMKKNGWGNYQEWNSDVINKQFDYWFPLCLNVLEI